MGETEKKLKVMSEGLKKKREMNWRRQLQRAMQEYKVPTPGLEKELFQVGQACDAAEFEEVKKMLARYVGVNFKHRATDAQHAVESLEVPDLCEPKDPAADASPVKLKKWEADYDDYRKNKKAWEDAKPRLYQLILSHCHPDMEQKVQASEKFEGINQDQDPVALLQLIRSIAHKHKDIKGGTMSIVEHDMGLFTCYQHPHWTNIEYYNLFKAARDVVNVHGGRAGFNKGLYEKALQGIKTDAGLDNDDT